MHAFELQPIDFRYILHGSGSATATLVVGNQIVEMAPTDLCDSPKDLLTALIRLRNGSPRAKVWFANEPGEHLLKLAPAAPAAVTLELWWFDDWKGDDLESDKKHVLTATVAFYEFERAVLRTVRELLETWGLKRYKYAWSHPFPSKEFETLIGDVR